MPRLSAAGISPSFPRKRWPQAKGGEDVKPMVHADLEAFGRTNLAHRFLHGG